MERTTPLNGLDTTSIDNVYLFVADSVRYDSVPDSVADRGRLFKMAAAGLCTPQSMSSIATGRYAPYHGVAWFEDSLNSEAETLFDLDVAAGYNEVVWDGRAVPDILGAPTDVDLETIDEPFVMLDHDNGGHSPYVGFDEHTTGEMFDEISDGAQLRKLYEETIEESTKRFEERLEILEKRDLLDNTLVIYFADHGELLGEYGGFVGHGLPSTPEVAYVPAVFIHDSIPNDQSDLFLQHVDLLPTIRSLVNEGATTGTTDGESLLTPIDPDRAAYTQGIMRPSKYQGTILDPNYDAPSIWTRDGGYVFNDTNKVALSATATYDALFSAYTGSFNSDRLLVTKLLTAFRHYFATDRTFGDPSISFDEARRMADRISSVSVETESRSLDGETKEHLEQLGYR